MEWIFFFSEYFFFQPLIEVVMFNVVLFFFS